MGMNTLPMWVQQAAYYAARGLVALPQVAGVKPSLRVASAMARRWALAPSSRKRLQRAMDHIAVAYPDWSEKRRLECAVNSFEHAFMLAVEIAFVPRLITPHAWHEYVEYKNAAVALQTVTNGRPTIFITGHCGNWELMGSAMAMLGYPIAAVYRPLDLKPLDDWLRRTRDRAGLRLVDKFGAIRDVPPLLEARKPVAFVADQNGGDRGIFVPFFGRLVASYKSIAVLAMQFQANIVIAQARRLGWRGERRLPGSTGERPFRFSIEVEDGFGPETYMAQPDPAYYLTARYRRAIEQMIRACPWDYFWMHRSWRSRPAHERFNKPFPDSLRRKIEALPWTEPGEIDRIVARSDEDRATLARLGVQRLP
jgi:KDO2-lipid IV(A) lauroyltransferase